MWELATSVSYCVLRILEVSWSLLVSNTVEDYVDAFALSPAEIHRHVLLVEYRPSYCYPISLC